MDDVWSEYALWKRIGDARPYTRGDSAERRAADQAARNLAFGLAIVAAYVEGAEDRSLDELEDYERSITGDFYR